MNERPPNEDDDVDEQYLRASARDASGPSEAVRRAILRHAAELAARRTGEGPAPQNASDRNARAGAQRSRELGPVPLDFKQPAANQPRWRPVAYGGLAAAALAGLLIAPHFLPASRPPTLSPPQAVQSASKKTEAAPTASFDALQAPAIPAPTPAPGGSDGTATESALAPRGQAPAFAAKPRAFANEAPLDEARDALLGVPRSALPASAPPVSAPAASAPPAAAAPALAPPTAAPPVQVAGLQRAFTVPPAQAVGSDSISALTAVRARAPTDSATALRQAAQRGDTSRLKALLDEQIDLDARDSAGRTALMLAVIGGQAQAVETLLARGADPNAADSSGTTPLAAALTTNHADIAAALRRAGAH